MLEGARPIRETVKWNKRTLRERCETLRLAVEGSTVPTEELEKYWPGGEENPGRDFGAWVWCWGSLMRFLGRDDRPEKRDQITDAAVAAALACEPHAVHLSDGTTRHVYPKSYHALRWLDSLDRTLLLSQTAADQALDVPAQNAVTTLGPLVESLAVRLWAWVLTHPEPGLPFDEQEAAEPPAWTATLSPLDLLTLVKAHGQVNATRNAIIAQAFPAPSDRKASRLSLSGFLGTVADDMGQRPYAIMRQWSLGELFAQRVTAAQASRDAMAKAS